MVSTKIIKNRCNVGQGKKYLHNFTNLVNEMEFIILRKRYLYLILIITFPIIFSINTCTDNENPLSFQNIAYESSYGQIVQVDEYPLYSIDYSVDYKFDEYLQTGILPFNSIEYSENNDFQCTCVFAGGGKNRLFGRNYDWNEYSTYYLVFTNPPGGYSSISMVDVSFYNYYHNESPEYELNQNVIRSLPYYPFDGMNEMGVVVGMNAVPHASSNYDTDKITIGELQLIRLVLDFASSTDEAISLIKRYNIRMEQPPIHYLIADSSGHSVAIEFIDGKMEVLENSKPWQVTTNFILKLNNTDHNAPCWRYRTAFDKLNEKNGILTENDTYNLIQEVSVSTTRWSTIFNQKTGILKIALGRNFDSPYSFSIP